MAKCNPSTSWTPEERLKVISEVVEGINPNNVVPSHVLFDVYERIKFLASTNAEFLERNRTSILNGQP